MQMYNAHIISCRDEIQVQQASNHYGSGLTECALRVMCIQCTRKQCELISFQCTLFS